MTIKTKPRRIFTAEERKRGGENKFNPQLAARVLAEALYIGDKRAAERFAVSDVTIRNWRARLATDRLFSTIFEELRAAAEVEWSVDVGETLRMCRAFIRGAAAEGEYTPEMVLAVTAAGAALQEAVFKREMLDARMAYLNEKNRVGLVGEGARQLLPAD